jgi:hypothetical protein
MGRLTGRTEQISRTLGGQFWGYPGKAHEDGGDAVAPEGLVPGPGHPLGVGLPADGIPDEP